MRHFYPFNTEHPGIMSSDVSSTDAAAHWRNHSNFVWTQQQLLQHQFDIERKIQNLKELGETETAGPADTSGVLMPTHSVQNDGEARGDGTPKDITDPWDTMDVHTAFLGPTLWGRRLPIPGPDFKLEYMELEDFLTENGIPVNPSVDNGYPGGKNGIVQSSLATPQLQPQQQHLEFSQLGGDCSPQTSFSVGSQFMGTSPRGPSHPARISHMRSLSSTNSSHPSRSPSPCGSSSSSCGEMTPAVSPDSTQTNGLKTNAKLAPDVPFSLAEMALGSVPGQDFDPRTRAFTDDELKPQPMIKKSRKQFVPDAQKDDKYWTRRQKNNMAAKRSRDARRVKENQIAMRAGFLEKENSVMKQELDLALKEITLLKEQLSRCRLEH